MKLILLAALVVAITYPLGALAEVENTEAAEPSDWEQREFTDEFGDPTGKTFILGPWTQPKTPMTHPYQDVEAALLFHCNDWAGKNVLVFDIAFTPAMNVRAQGRYGLVTVKVKFDDDPPIDFASGHRGNLKVYSIKLGMGRLEERPSRLQKELMGKREMQVAINWHRQSPVFKFALPTAEQVAQLACVTDIDGDASAAN